MAVDSRVSVVIVNYNAGALLAQSVATALRSPAVREVIVVDNASTDDSLFRLRLCCGDRGDVVILENLVNLGFASASNRGAAATTGDYILYLNPDNLVADDNVEIMLQVMESDPQAGMAGCLVVNPDGSEQRGCRRNDPGVVSAVLDMIGHGRASPDRYDLKGTVLPQQPVTVPAISGSFMFVRRSALEQVGPLDEGYFLHCEDLDWCRRFRDRGYRILFVPTAVATHYQGSCSAGEPVKVSWYKHRGMLRYYRKFGPGGVWNPWWLAMAAAIWFHFMATQLLALRGRQGGTPTGPAPVHALATMPAERAAQADGERPQIVVAGAGSMLADYLLPLLLARGHRVVALSRSAARHLEVPGLRWYADAQALLGAGLEGRHAVLINLAPLWVLPELIRVLAPLGLDRIIAFGSTSRFGKQFSDDAVEQELVRTLADAERHSAAAADTAGVALTLFRPALIYNGGRDRNVSAIARFVRRYRIFPLLGAGTGLRQPVHAQDLARACVAALDRPVSAGRTYDLGGGERIAYRDMVRRIFLAAARRPVLVPVPRPLFVLAARAARLLPAYRDFRITMADRMNQDLVYDQQAAVRDLGWAPPRFLAGILASEAG